MRVELQKRNPLLQLSVWCIETLLAFTVPGILFLTMLAFIFPGLHDIRAQLNFIGIAGTLALCVIWPTVSGMMLCSIGTFFVDLLIKLFQLDKRIESLAAHKQKTQLIESFSMQQLTHDIIKFVTPNREYLSSHSSEAKETMHERLAPTSTMHLFNQAIMGIILIISAIVIWNTVAKHDWDSLKYSIPSILVITFIWLNITLSFYTDYLTRLYNISINVAIKHAKNSINRDRGFSHRSQSSRRQRGNQRHDQNDSRKFQSSAQKPQQTETKTEPSTL